MALFDVDILKRSEQHSRRAKAFAEMIVEDMSQPLAILQPDLKIRQVNEAFAALFKLAPEDTKGRSLAEMGGASWRLSTWLPAATAKPGTPLPAIEIPADRAGRWETPLTVSGRVVPSPEPSESSLVLLTVSVAD
jgi:PAS domain-containing protein